MVLHTDALHCPHRPQGVGVGLGLDGDCVVDGGEGRAVVTVGYGVGGVVPPQRFMLQQLVQAGLLTQLVLVPHMSMSGPDVHRYGCCEEHHALSQKCAVHCTSHDFGKTVGVGESEPQPSMSQQLVQPASTDHVVAVPHCPLALPEVQRYGVLPEHGAGSSAHIAELHAPAQGTKHDAKSQHFEQTSELQGVGLQPPLFSPETHK